MDEMILASEKVLKKSLEKPVRKLAPPSAQKMGGRPTYASIVTPPATKLALFYKEKLHIEGAYAVRQLRSNDTSVCVVGLPKKYCLEDGAARGALRSEGGLSYSNFRSPIEDIYKDRTRGLIVVCLPTEVLQYEAVKNGIVFNSMQRGGMSEMRVKQVQFAEGSQERAWKLAQTNPGHSITTYSGTIGVETTDICIYFRNAR
ncbi:hypothetical protein BGHDH14_bgh03595 [Blumeria hordei DH14]|uniref:Uncharacterized protein n=1 Tax=Blumeria graminis f. sp. hordei (strain DH14) TaxID=546991 RepID=N1JFC6_BLUG1|nr:hypothetical protein BGHDH14_bgh03595 [Blumeria hordei DH14]